jgi:hypothetical protein
MDGQLLIQGKSAAGMSLSTKNLIYLGGQLEIEWKVCVYRSAASKPASDLRPFTLPALLNSFIVAVSLPAKMRGVR